MTEKAEVNELWAKLTKIPRPHRIVDFPRIDPDTKKYVGQIAMWPLTQEEQMICNAEADRFAKRTLKESQKKDEANFGYEHTFGNDVAVQILFRICRDAKDLKKAFFPSTNAIRHELAAEEVSALFNMYMMVQVELGPIIRYMDDEACEAMVRKIQESGTAFPFNLLSLEQQHRLLTFMASKLVSSWTATSSAGLPQGDLPPSESEEDPTTVPDDQEPIKLAED